MPKIEIKTAESANAATPVQLSPVRRDSNDKAVRLLNHLAESQKFCKVYDSVNDVTLRKTYNENTSSNNNTSEELVTKTKSSVASTSPVSSSSMSHNAGLASPSTSAATSTAVTSKNNTPQLKQHQKIDSEKIIQTNFENVRRKESVVLSKVRLWDKSIESGEIITDRWDKEFLPEEKE